MPRHSQICTVCQHIDENLIVHAGEFPPCSKCGGATERMWSGEAAPVHQDSIEGGRFFENGFDEPRKFYSHSEHEAALAAEGLELRPMNRGDNDKICPRWDQPCEATLESARILLSRGAQAASERNARRNRWPNASMEITVTEGERFRMKQER